MTFLTFRRLRRSDLSVCRRLLVAEGVRGALLDLDLLDRVLTQRRLVGRVIEQRREGRSEVCGVGFSALLNPEVAARAIAGDLGDVVERAVVSVRSPEPWLLDRAAQAHGHAAGRLHMLVLDFAVEAAGADEAAVTAALHAAFLQAHSGYGLAALLAEIRPWERKATSYRDSLLAAGCREAPAPAGAATRVLVLARAQIAAQPYHILQPLFVHRAPAVPFTPAQQDLLEAAVLGASDAEAAAELGITTNTIHKRWRAIYARAARAGPALLGGEPTERMTRGGEKRRLMVEYARAHPEVLRPWAMGRNPQ